MSETQNMIAAIVIGIIAVCMYVNLILIMIASAQHTWNEIKKNLHQKDGNE